MSPRSALTARTAARPVAWAALLLAPLALAGCPQETAQQQPAPAAPTAPAGDDKPDAPPPPPPPKPFDMATAKTPWRLCKVGDWATYKMHSAPGNPVFKFEVTAVEGTKVTVARKTEAGELKDTQDFDIAEEEARYKDPMTYDALDGTPQKQTVDVGGKQVEVLVVKRKKGDSSTELWLAEETVRPFVQSAVKSIRNGKLEIELLDFGAAQ